MATLKNPDLSDADDGTWDAVRESLERFVQAWDQSGPPSAPASFLPDGPPSVRRLALVELIKIDIEHRLQHGIARPLEEYLAECPELSRSGLPCDLLYEDYQLRRQNGLLVEPDDYYRRFPAQARELRQLLSGLTAWHATSSLAARLPVEFAAGDRVDEFDLLGLLGEGRFAQVFLARQRGMQRLVALKISRPRGTEAQTLARLDHPHIVRVYDQRFLHDRDLLLVYMPYLPGGTLHDVLQHARQVPPEQRCGRTLLEAVDAALERQGALPPAASQARLEWAARSWPATVCALGMKLARALAYAHRHHVLHRDIKPHNILLSAEGEPLLADFNVGCCSKLDGAGPAALFGGSLGYMAPEHLEAFNPAHPRPPDSLDGRADVYSLAVTLWELLTGCRPFSVPVVDADWQEMLTHLTRERQAGLTLHALHALDEGNVRGLRELLCRCLEPDPDRRLHDAGTMARELELCLRPATRELVRQTTGWSWVRHHPWAATYAAGFLPNVLAALVSLGYVRSEIVQHWDNALPVFDRLIFVINGVFAPIGMFFWALLMLTMGQALRAPANPSGSVADQAEVRWRWLRLGQFGALLCVGCWLVAGAVWALALRLLVGPAPAWSFYLHLVLALSVCGLMVAAYPYFFITYLNVHVLYPALLGSNGPSPVDVPVLRRLQRELGFFRALATAVPLLALTTLAAVYGVSTVAPVVLLSVAGLAGALVSFALERNIHADLDALMDLPKFDAHSAVLPDHGALK